MRPYRIRSRYDHRTRLAPPSPAYKKANKMKKKNLKEIEKKKTRRRKVRVLCGGGIRSYGASSHLGANGEDEGEDMEKGDDGNDQYRDRHFLNNTHTHSFSLWFRRWKRSTERDLSFLCFCLLLLFFFIFVAFPFSTFSNEERLLSAVSVWQGKTFHAFFWFYSCLTGTEIFSCVGPT